jgi:AhpD family alkylhydroperoxidase
MIEPIYLPTTPEIAARRKELAPEIHEAFEAFSHAVFADGAVPEKTKQLIAVAVAHTTQCSCCIQGHTRLAAQGRQPAGDHGGDLGRARDARRRRVRALHPGAVCARRSAPDSARSSWICAGGLTAHTNQPIASQATFTCAARNASTPAATVVTATKKQNHPNARLPAFRDWLWRSAGW